MRLGSANKYSALLWVRAAAALVAEGFLCGAAAAFSPLAACVLAAVSLGGYFFLIGYYISRFCASIELSMDDELFRLKKGVVFARVYAVPLNCVRFFELRHSLLSSLFGVCSLLLHTASGRVRACGLDMDEAVGLTKAMEAMIYDKEAKA